MPQLRRALSRHAFAPPPAADSEQPEDDTAPTHPRPTRQLPCCRAGGSERRACARPTCRCTTTDGRFQLRYSAPAPIGALVEQALKEAKDALFLDASGPREGEATGADQTDSHGIAASDRPTHADALEELAQRSLSSVTSTGRASHYRVYLHLSTDGAWVNGGGALPRRLLDRFVSDGVVQPVWETEGRPVSVGRSMRILPRRSRRLIEDRDRGCRFPGCTATRFVEIHHLHEWAAGGRPTSTTR